MSNELICLDTNILVYATQRQDEHYAVAHAVRERAKAGRIAACISPQVLNEFFATITNPRRVIHPVSPPAAMAEVTKYIRSRNIRKIYPGTKILTRVQALFDQHPVTAQEIYDLFLVATMLENGVTKVYTFNTDDFAPFSEIEVLTPTVAPSA